MVGSNVPVVKKHFPSSQTQVLISKLVKERRSKIVIVVVYVKNHLLTKACLRDI